MGADDWVNERYWDEEDPDPADEQEERELMRRRREREYEDVGEVEVKKVTGNAMLCRWLSDGALAAGSERWIPFSQAEGAGPGGMHMEGDTIQLRVTDWLAERLADEGDGPKEKPSVELPGAVVMRESEKAIQVRLPGVDGLVWIPKTQIAEDSEVKFDGDSGVLKVSEWIAKEKNLVPGGAGGGGDPRQQDLPGTGRTAGDAARNAWGARPEEREALPDDADDLPF